jgi:hypothetical protein
VSTSIRFRPVFNTDDGIGIFTSAGRNRIDEAFDLAGEVTIPAGDYPFRSVTLFAQSGTSRVASVDFNGEVERTFGGTVKRATTSVSTSPGIHLSLRGGYTFSRASMPGGDFDVQLVSLRAGYAFTTRLSLNTLAQYNSLSRDVSVNARLNFIYRPGSDLFLVLNEERGSDLSAWDLRDRGIRLKVAYLARL